MALLTLLPAMHGWAADVYFYSASNSQSVESVKGVQRIEFTPTGVNVVTTDGKTIPVSASNFDYVMFRDKTTGIGSVKTSSDQGIVFSINSDAVRLTSEKPFSSVELIDESGRKVAQGKVDGTQASISLASIDNGIYVVKAVAGSKTSVKKIVKK